MFFLWTVLVTLVQCQGEGTEGSHFLQPIVIDRANLSQIYTNAVNHTTEYLYDFEYTEEQVGSGALRVYIVSDDSQASVPVLVVVRHEKGVLSWQLPMMVQEGLEYSSDRQVLEFRAVNRTLCPLDKYHGKQSYKSALLRSTNSEPHRLAVSVSTASTKSVAFSLVIYVESGYMVDMNETRIVQVSPSAPQYFFFRFPPDLDTALITVQSPDEFCMTMSIQNESCPVNDLDRSIQFEGSWQTVDRKTGMSIRRDLYPNGLHIVFVVKPSNLACKSYLELEPLTPADHCHGPCRNKTVEFTIVRKITKEEYIAATFGAFGMFMGAYFIVILVSCIICVKIRKVPIERTLFDAVPDYGTMQRDSARDADNNIDGIVVEEIDDDDDSSINEEDIDMLTDAEVDKEVFRTKTFLFVSDLARKSPKVLSKKSQLYQWNLVTVATFYALPAIQLVVTYQTVFNQTGNEDMCYYNFLCAHPLGLLSDFNHVYSNLGYIMLGGLFMVFTWRRDYMYQQLVEANRGIDRKYGIPHHSGMFYAMGFALVMEGLMSGSYHICPNHSNFQFDTAFMYTIAILCMLKIYQFRHPDINANAYTAFGVLAFVIFIGMLGVVDGGRTFWIGFTGLYIVSCFILSIQIYYMGRWKIDGGLAKRVWLMISHDVISCCSGSWYSVKPMYPDRMLLLIIFNIVNYGMAAFGIVKLLDEGGDFASFLLAIFIMNLLLYTAFYILMKLRHGERICRQPLTYILVSWVSWAGAMYFFINKSTSWAMSPAESRHFNTECQFLHFYDNHDIWHFLSATSLFLSFMILLTLDDDLAEKPREKIPVF